MNASSVLPANESIYEVIYDYLRAIANEPSSNRKIEMLKEAEQHVSLPHFQQVLIWANHPQIRFYLTPPAYLFKEVQDTQDIPMFTEAQDMADFLQALSNRSISGNAAKYAYQQFRGTLTPKVQTLLDDILEKDLKVGFGVSSINKAFKKLIPDMPYMRCSLITDIKKPELWLSPTSGVISQEKMDGMFFNIDVLGDGDIVLTSRNGSLFPDHSAFYEIKSVVANFRPAMQYHGEMLVTDKTGKILPREESNGLLNALLKSDNSKSKGARFDSNQYSLLLQLWDAIPHALLRFVGDNKAIEQSENNLPYSERLASLASDIQRADSKVVQLVDTRYYSSIADAEEHFKQMLSEGKEGCVVKLPEMRWKDGTSREQVKLKNKFTIELRIVGFNEGTGKNKDLFGSLNCISEDGLLEVNVSSSGMSETYRKHVSDERNKYMGQVVSVTANSIMHNKNGGRHSLFLPVFEEIRSDKHVADTFQRICEQFDNSVNLQQQIELLKASKKS